MDPDPDKGHKHFLISLTKEEFKILFPFFVYFHANTSFGLIFFCRFLILTLRSGSEDPHIRIRKAKMLRIHWIRILSIIYDLSEFRNKL